MSIRAGTSDDIEACVGLWVGALQARDGVEQGPEVAARARAKFTRPIVRFAVVGDEPSAFALTVDEGARADGRVALLELLAVAPGEAGRGVGRALLGDAIRSATRLGHTSIELDVRAGNSRAEKLYASAGFTPQGDPTPHPLGGPPMIRRALPLRAEADLAH
ncbi:GNAT family N-acetyltransferase [Herbiconiux sp. P18]|uniref:GNAT family N-acetyltransferase n=1 Tax=Herbiconiux liangxiaofengii TaxID=3342795 RepID=UPI0035BA1408